MYGTKGVSSSLNSPPARYNAVGWTDTSGNLWLFGGITVINTNDRLNDLWKFSAGNWTWISGNRTGAAGYYVQLGVPNPANYPSGRSSATACIDSDGAAWIFGGINCL